MMSRFFDTAISVSENKEYIPKIANKAIIMWVVANVFVQSQYGMQPDILNNGLSKFYKTWSNQTPNDYAFRGVWIKMLSDGVKSFWFDIY